MPILPPHLCEAPYCLTYGDPYECWASPIGPTSRHYFCQQCAPNAASFGGFYRVVAVHQSQIGPALISTKVAPGTLCSVIGCTAPAVDEVEGLIHVGNRLFLDFKGALCQSCLDEDFVEPPKEFRRSLSKVHVR